MLVGVARQTCQTICLGVFQLAAGDGIANMNGKEAAYSLDTGEVEIASTALLGGRYGAMTVLHPEVAIGGITQQVQIMGTTSHYNLTGLEMTGVFLDVSVPCLTQNIGRNKELSSKPVAIVLVGIMCRNLLACMASTDSQHDVGSLVYQGEQLGRLAVGTIHKDIRCHLIDQREAPTLAHLQSTLRVVAHHSVVCNEEARLFQLLGEQSHCDIGLCQAESPAWVKCQLSSEQVDGLADRGLESDAVHQLAGVYLVLCEVFGQPVLTIANVIDGVIDIQVEMVVIACLSTEHGEGNGFSRYFMQEQVAKGDIEPPGELLQLVDRRQFLPRESTGQLGEGFYSLLLCEPCSSVCPFKHLGVDIIESCYCHGCSYGCKNTILLLNMHLI